MTTQEPTTPTVGGLMLATADAFDGNAVQVIEPIEDARCERETAR